MQSKLQKPLGFLLLALLLVAGAYWRLFFQPMKYDAADEFYQVQFFMSECLRAGILPLWNPFMDLGLPHHADMQTGVHYLFNWFYNSLFEYDLIVFNIQFLLHLSMAGLGMFFFLKSYKVLPMLALFLGLGYALSGHFLSNGQHLSWVVSTAYLPWVWGFFVRMFRQPSLFNALGLALFMCFMTTGGYPIFTLLSAYAMLIYFPFHIKKENWKKVIAYFALAAGLFILCSIGYIYSVYDVWEDLGRSAGMTYEKANMNPYSPQSLFGLFAPEILIRRIHWMDSDSSMTNSYQGVFFSWMLLLAFVAKPMKGKRVLIGLTILFLLLSFGDYFFLRRLTFHLPFMDLFRHIAIFRIFFILFSYPIIAELIQQIIDDSKVAQRFKIMLFVSAGLYLLYILAGLIVNLNYWVWDHIVGSVSIQCLFIIIGILIWQFIKDKKRALRFILLLNVLNLIAMHQFNMKANLVADRSIYELQEVLNQYEHGFHADNYQNDTISHISSYGNEQTTPIHYNLSLISKDFACNMVYPFVMKRKDQLEKTPDYWTTINGPLLFAPKQPELISQLVEFHPNYFKFSLQSPNAQKVHLRFCQFNYKHWRCEVNGEAFPFAKEPALMELADLPLQAGANTIEFRYHAPLVKVTLWLGLGASLLCLLGLLVIYFKRQG